MFATSGAGIAQFAQNITALWQDGANVIVDDEYYTAEPMFQDGKVAQAVDNAVSHGVAYFSSAGNYGTQGFDSQWRAGPVVSTNSVMLSGNDAEPFPGGTSFNFSSVPGVVDNAQSITLQPGATLNLALDWDSPSASAGGIGTPNVLGAYLFDATLSGEVAGADSAIGKDAVGHFTYTNSNTKATNYDLMIVLESGPAPTEIKYVIVTSNYGSVTINDYATDSSTLFGHANAAGAVAIGAADYTATPAFGASPAKLEAFSSVGGTPILFDTSGNRYPTPQIRQHPDFVAPDGVETTFFEGTPKGPNQLPQFFGTSAAAPSAAAVAALMLQADPALTPQMIHDTLATTAIAMSTTSTNSAGAGLIDASAAVTSVRAQATGSPVPITINAGTKAGDGSPDTFVLRRDAGNKNLLDVSVDNQFLTFSAAMSDLGILVIQGSSDDDKLTIDGSNGPITANIEFDAGAGNNSLIFSGAPFTAVTIGTTGPGAGTITIGGATVHYSGVNTVNTTTAPATSPIVIDSTASGNDIKLPDLWPATTAVTVNALPADGVWLASQWTLNASGGAAGGSPLNYVDGNAALTVTGQTADLAVTVTVPQSLAFDGATLDYQIQVSNNGPSDVVGARVVEQLPPGLTGVSYTATQTGGATGFSASGSGAIVDAAVNLPHGATITYTVQGTLSNTAVGPQAIQARIVAPTGLNDSNAANNSQQQTIDVVQSQGVAVTGHEWTNLASVPVALLNLGGASLNVPLTATIAWGDGETTPGSIQAISGGYLIVGSHEYHDEGTYPVIVQFAGGGLASAVATTAVMHQELMP
ncbi:MAG: S8 family serine peptidase, partial [Pirellulales bacterium]